MVDFLTSGKTQVSAHSPFWHKFRVTLRFDFIGYLERYLNSDCRYRFYDPKLVNITVMHPRIRQKKVLTEVLENFDPVFVCETLKLDFCNSIWSADH